MSFTHSKGLILFLDTHLDLFQFNMTNINVLWYHPKTINHSCKLLTLWYMQNFHYNFLKHGHRFEIKLIFFKLNEHQSTGLLKQPSQVLGGKSLLCCQTSPISFRAQTGKQCAYWFYVFEILCHSFWAFIYHLPVCCVPAFV